MAMYNKSRFIIIVLCCHHIPHTLSYTNPKAVQNAIYRCSKQPHSSLVHTHGETGREKRREALNTTSRVVSSITDMTAPVTLSSCLRTFWTISVHLHMSTGEFVGQLPEADCNQRLNYSAHPQKEPGSAGQEHRRKSSRISGRCRRVCHQPPTPISD